MDQHTCYLSEVAAYTIWGLQTDLMEGKFPLKGTAHKNINAKPLFGAREDLVVDMLD